MNQCWVGTPLWWVRIVTSGFVRTVAEPEFLFYEPELESGFRFYM